MSYISANELADIPGATELAQVASSEHGDLVAYALMEATLRGADRSAFSPADIAEADDALARISAAIAETDEFVDGFLALRFALPLPTVPSIVSSCARNIVRYRLHKNLRDDDRSNPIVRDYRDAVKFLEQIRDGKLSIGINDPAAEQNSMGDVQFESPPKVFGREQLKAFR